MAKFTVKRAIDLNGTLHRRGDVIELTEAQAKAMTLGQIESVTAPAPQAAAPPPAAAPAGTTAEQIPVKEPDPDAGKPAADTGAGKAAGKK